MNKSRINMNRSVVPSRSKSAVNKSINNSKKDKQKEKTVMKNQVDDERLDEIFEKNLSMAIALLPTLPMAHATNVRKWLTRLFDRQLLKSRRNSFLAFLIFQMQNMKIADPFDQKPPQNLPDPSKMMLPAKWKTYMKEADEVFQERVKERLCLEQWGRFKKEFKSPMDFFEDQPAPANGIVCYGGCFSNHFVKSYKKF
jgi:hypothetical protein